jgi:tetratricopeptide (TPR) repeat protein
MYKMEKIVGLLLIVLTFVSSCNDKESSSPFDKVLTQPPYADLTDSIKNEPRRDDLYFRRGVLLNSNDLTEPALADFKKAWSLMKNEKYAFGLGNLLLDKKPDSAIVFLNDALKELPESFLLQLTLARSYNKINKTDEALKICNAILEKNPTQVDVMKMKAELLDKKGNIPESISILEKAYSITPYDIELNYELAYKYAENKNVKVIKLCDSLIKIDSLQIHAQPHYYKGIYYSNIGDKAKALSLFDLAIVYDKFYMNAFIEKGRILYEQKKIADAFKVFELANTLSNAFPDAYYWMGKCQEALGQKEEAKLNYQRAYSLDKTFIEAKEAIDAIKN